MDILMSEFETDYFLINEYGKFHPTYTCDDVKEIKDDMGIIIGHMYINLVITKTAQQSYDEYLNPVPKEPDKIEALQQQLKQQEAAIGLLATQIAKNTLLQDRGMR